MVVNRLSKNTTMHVEVLVLEDIVVVVVEGKFVLQCLFFFACFSWTTFVSVGVDKNGDKKLESLWNCMAMEETIVQNVCE